MYIIKATYNNIHTYTLIYIPQNKTKVKYVFLYTILIKNIFVV